MKPISLAQFRASECFGILRRGIVFRGFVEAGHIRTGDWVFVPGKDRTHTARVAAIERARKLIEESVHNVELGLLLDPFDEPTIHGLVHGNHGSVEDSMPPAPENVLGLEFPLLITVQAYER